MISRTIPINNKGFNVVACYLECEGKIVLLHRNANKPHGNTWGLPAGKVDTNETLLEAVLREVREETGCVIDEVEVAMLPSLWVEHNGVCFNYHSFLVNLNQIPEITLNPGEHQNYRWVTPQESLDMHLIHDLDDCNRLFFKL